MVAYQCIECQKEINSDAVKKRVRCPYCGSKILFKPKNVATVVDAI